MQGKRASMPCNINQTQFCSYWADYLSWYWHSDVANYDVTLRVRNSQYLYAYFAAIAEVATFHIIQLGNEVLMVIVGFHFIYSVHDQEKQNSG